MEFGNVDIMEMQQISLDAIEMPYYSVDEAGVIMAASTLDSSMIVENIGWDLMPTLGTWGRLLPKEHSGFWEVLPRMASLRASRPSYST